MKKYIYILIGHLFIFNSFAQIKVLVNDKEISEGSVISVNEIQTVKIKFSTTNKANTSTNGIAKLTVSYYNMNNVDLWNYHQIKAKGSTACDLLLNNNEKEYILYNSNQKDCNFKDGNVADFMEYISSSSNYLTQEILNTEVKVTYCDKIGVEKYGDDVELVKNFKFKINTLLKPGKAIVPLINAFIDIENSKKINFKGTFKPNEITGVQDDEVVGKIERFVIPETKYSGQLVRVLNCSTNGKSQEEAIKIILNSYIEELIYNTQLREGKNPGNNLSKCNYWRILYSHAEIKNDKAKGKRKSIDMTSFSESIMIGKMQGYKVVSSYTNNQTNQEENGKNSYLYVFPHPNDKKKIILFCKAFNPKATTEFINNSTLELEEFIKLLEF